MKQTIHLILYVAVTILMAGCTGGGGTEHVPQASDSLYTEEAIRDIYGTQPERALVMIDSAEIVGNLTDDRADLLRATVYSRAFESMRQDTAIVIGERLLKSRTAQENAAFRQNVLEVLVYSTRQMEDYELQLVYSTELTDAYSQQGDKVETLRTEAEIGTVLYRLGKTDEGLAKIDNVINDLNPVRQFNELDASIIAMKRKIGVLRDYPLIASTAQGILDRLADYEQHPADFHDGSEREPTDEARPGYIAFYRSQAWAYLAAAYAHLSEKGKVNSEKFASAQKAREYVSLFEQSDFGQTLAGRKMIAPTLCLLGEYDKMETVYQELEAVFMERGDTLTLDYAQLLLDRAKAAEAQGRMKESTTLWQKHAEVLQKSEERLLQSKANLYAARYHAQEQQLEIQEKQAEAERSHLISLTVAVIALLAIAIAVYFFHQKRIVSEKNRALVRMINEQAFPGDSTAELSTPLPIREGSGESLFNSIDAAIRTERLYTNIGLQRQDICDRFDISRHTLNDLLAEHTGGLSFPQYVNNIRLEETLRLLRDEPCKTISAIATEVGFSSANLREQFKRKYGITPAEYRQNMNV